MNLNEFLATADTARLLRAYFKLDNEAKEADKRAKKAKALKKIIAQRLGAIHLKDGGESYRHDLGTIYTKGHSSVVLTDRADFLAFVKSRNLWSIANVQPYKQQVLDFIESKHVVPDGIKVDRWQETHVNRPAKSKTNVYIGD